MVEHFGEIQWNLNKMLMKFKMSNEMVSVQGVIHKKKKIVEGDIKVKVFANSI